METARRTELAQFLRARRAALAPHDVDLPNGGRRRIPGLRREEVAVLADVSVSWYTFLEQGRPIRISAAALARIASALRLGPQEARHMFLLADRSPITRSSGDAVPAAVAALIDDFAESPAWLVNPLYDVRAWNRAASAVWLDLDTVSGGDRNLIWLIHTHPGAQARHANWKDDAQRMMAALRARTAENKDDARFAELVDRLSQASPTFRDQWPRHDVAYPPSRAMNMAHPEVGELRFSATTLLPEAAPGLRLLVWTPDPDSPTRRRVRRLLARDG